MAAGLIVQLRQRSGLKLFVRSPVAIFLILLAVPEMALAGRGNDLVHAQLFTDTARPEPNQLFYLNVHFTIEPGWHIYWRNPGDSGLPTKLKLHLPPGYVAGEVEYPLPTRLMLPGDIMNYAYENQATLVVPVTAPATVSPGDTFQVDASWLVCQDVCLPGKTSLSITTGNAAVVKSWQALKGSAQLPVDRDPSVLGVSIKAESRSVVINVMWNVVAPTDVQFFPPPTPGFEISSISCETKSDRTTIQYQLITTTGSPPAPTNGLLEFTVAGGRRVGLNLNSLP